MFVRLCCISCDVWAIEKKATYFLSVYPSTLSLSLRMCICSGSLKQRDSQSARPGENPQGEMRWLCSVRQKSGLLPISTLNPSCLISPVWSQDLAGRLKLRLLAVFPGGVRGTKGHSNTSAFTSDWGDGSCRTVGLQVNLIVSPLTAESVQFGGCHVYNCLSHLKGD